ncbi:MAG: hypothetical protein ACFFG0_00710 [Candidatus Thorarchaeota archaeon]
MKPRFLASNAKFNVFFRKVKPGDLIRYSISFFPDEVIRMAKKYGITLKYMKSGTPEHKKFGSNILKVISEKKVEPFKPELFNPDKLDL